MSRGHHQKAEEVDGIQIKIVNIRRLSSRHIPTSHPSLAVAADQVALFTHSEVIESMVMATSPAA